VVFLPLIYYSDVETFGLDRGEAGEFWVGSSYASSFV